MNILIGDIGNTITKVCLVKNSNSKVKKIVYLNTKNISSKNYLKKKLNGIIGKQSVNKIALFSSVVPKYQIILRAFLRKS